DAGRRVARVGPGRRAAPTVRGRRYADPGHRRDRRRARPDRGPRPPRGLRGVHDHRGPVGPVLEHRQGAAPARLATHVRRGLAPVAPGTSRHMERRRLGGEGLEVSAQGLGCMGMTWAYGGGDEETGLRTIHRALELGVTFLDTAEVYGPYTNERLVGRAIAG